MLGHKKPSPYTFNKFSVCNMKTALNVYINFRKVKFNSSKQTFNEIVE